MKQLKKRAIFGWALYNWGHDAFAIVVTTFVFSAYFADKIATSHDAGMSEWGWSISITAIIVGILSPFLGALADVTGSRKLELTFFTLITILATGALVFAAPNHHWVYWSLILYGIGLFGFELSLLYYNAMLKSIVPKSLIGRVSNWGWGCGYLGGIVALLIALFVFVEPHFITHANSWNVRLVSLFVALWMLVFCWPILVTVKERANEEVDYLSASTFRSALKSLGHMFKEVKHYSVVYRFVIARLFYIDALNTVFAFSGIYAVMMYHFSLTEVLYFGLFANIVAGVGCFIFSFIDDWLGPRFVVFWALLILIASIVVIFFSQSVLYFWIFGMVIALVSGPIQASSRSYLTHISPKNLINQLFGFYTLTGRVTAFIGPLATSILVYSLHNIKMLMVVIFVLAVIGWLIFLTVPSTKRFTLDSLQK